MTDLLVLGATGFTGRLITEHLYSHPERSSFTLGLAGRSRTKLTQLKQSLGLDDSVKLFEVDVTNNDQLEQVVKSAKVVINTIGPFSKWGTPVIRICALNGIHYVDLSGEIDWIRDIIEIYDYLATKTHTIIIPSSGMDAIPSDLAVHLSNKTLKALVSPDTSIDTSMSAYRMHGGISGGSISTMITNIEEVPRWKRRVAMSDFVLSNVTGVPQPKPRLSYTLPFSNPPVYGGIVPMGPANRSIIQRTWGLHQYEASQKPGQKVLTYGPQFKYDEFMITKSKTTGALMSIGLVFGMLSLMITPIRWLVKKFAPQPGEGPSPELQKNGFLELINVTSSVPTATQPQRHVRTTIKGQGDPGYSLTAVMISESALSILLHHDELPSLAQEGGILTPMSALGDVLVRRLEKSGRFQFESEIIIGKDVEGRKRR
ncbi:unnamed protein product [Somion occarium]|uniref:Saccharopine dehydrogenase NADP binding domain-containing protein n=1 Tax=Somion occarium TaxID=3059160 RepID=A0ABP1DYF4_9APHY